MDLSDLHITRDDYEFFKELKADEKIEFLWDSQYMDGEYSLMSNIEDEDDDDFNDEAAMMEDNDIPVQEEYYDTTNGERLTLFMVNQHLYLNCTSLKLLRAYTRKLVFNDGILLAQVKSTRKTEYDKFKYFKCYRIIGKGMPISPQ